MTPATGVARSAFLGLLFKQTQGLIELRALPSAARAFVAPGDDARLEQFVASNPDANLYFGVATRGDATSGALDNCASLPALFVDIDFKILQEPEAWERLNAFPLPVSILVHSGGGLHSYWLLEEPLDLRTEAARAKSLLRRLAHALGGDLNAAEPARILRLPDTLNLKYDPPRPVRVEFFGFRCSYDASQFDDLLLQAPGETAQNGNGQHAGFHMPEQVREGERNSHLYRLARSLKTKGLSREAILAALKAENTVKCDPPLDEAEVARIAAHAMEQPDRDGFTPHGANADKTAASDALPIIDATIDDLKTLCGKAWSALTASNTPPRMFRYGAMPVRIEHDDAGRLVMHELTRERLRHEMARCAHWMKQKGKNLVDIAPPLHVIIDMLATPDLPLPVLVRIVQVPVFTADGRRLDTLGYDESSRLYYAPDLDAPIPLVADRPSCEDIARAKALFLDDLFGDFPFVADADRAHTLALALLPYVREMIPGPTPAHLVEAPEAGSGKGLLVKVALSHAAGRIGVPVVAPAATDEEWRKRLTAHLRQGFAAVCIDNVTRPIESGILAAALTAIHWQDRLLGKTEMISLPVRVVWSITANNPVLTTELARRCVRIRIDPKIDRPWLRDGFRHPDLPAWADAHRAELIWAALTLGQAWIAAGRPKSTCRVLGSFEDWSRVLGGILHVAKVPGFLDNILQFYESTDSEGAALRAFIAEWWDHFQSAPVGTKDLLAVAQSIDALSLGHGTTDRSQQTALGILLARQRDRVIGNYRVEAAGTRQRAAQWRLIEVSGDDVNVSEPGKP